MGNPKAFLSVGRQEAGYRPVSERLSDFSEVEQTLNTNDRKTQASRCMDCGVPFCHWACPVGNKQPEWQDMAYKGKWREAYLLLEKTCDFPEFTGRICPALCEKSCVLKHSIEEPVTIRENEAAIAETAFREGYIRPVTPVRNNKKIAVIGSGPAGLTVANRLNRLGYSVTVFEKEERAGGLLRFGIPNFKLNKKVIDRRIALMEAEGVVFKLGTKAGKDVSAKALTSGFDALCLAIGCETPRDLDVEGRKLKGIHFAMELLSRQNKVLGGLSVKGLPNIDCKGKKILVIGGGDTGSDCVGTANRQGAVSVTQIEILPKPPVDHNPDTPWPQYPNILKTSTSHEEGCDRRWSLTTNRFIGEAGVLKAVEVEEVEWVSATDGGRPTPRPTGRKETLEIDLVFLSMGFVYPEQEGLVKELALSLDARKNIATDTDGRTAATANKIFACGDAVSGPSLVVRAIAAGRRTASAIDTLLKDRS